jgi:hypothetical protein
MASVDNLDFLRERHAPPARRQKEAAMLGHVNVKKTIHNESEVNECGEHFIEFFES